MIKQVKKGKKYIYVCSFCGYEKGCELCPLCFWWTNEIGKS